jgi:L-alanine-DL-glutamate epimerase-like enolase superfamily enzyme
MKISKIETFPIALGLKRPFRIANASFTHMYYVIIKVQTDDGVTGYGESIPAWEVTGETQFSVMDCIHHLTEESKLGFTLIGREVSSLQDVAGIMDILCPDQRANIFWGAPSAKAGLEEALLDIVGKSQRKPIYELFGGRPKPVLYAHVLGIGPVQETLSKAKALLERGVDKIKLKIGVENLVGLENHRRDVEVVLGVKKLIEETRPRAKLVADANQGFTSPEKAVAFLKQVPGCLDYLEQPVIAGNRLGLRKIKDQCDVALMADESLHSCHDARLLLQLGAVDVFNVKLMKCGGMFEALKLAELAKMNGKRAVLGSMLENQLGAVPSIHAFFCEDSFESTESGFFSCLSANVGAGLSVDGNFIDVPAGPGTGLRVNESDFAEHLLRPSQSKTLEHVLRLYR